MSAAAKGWTVMGRPMRAIVFGLLAFASAAPAPTEKAPSLPKKYDAWLREEVVYIISSVEREVFLKLESDRDRDLFIEEFWKQRDPTPGTPRNEYRDEHYRRIDFADKTFARGEGGKGWRTDRGRFYIMLGPPADVEPFTSAVTYPAELWYYQGNPAFGQPAVFRLLFYQKNGGGPMVLFEPGVDRPKDLVPNTEQDSPGMGARPPVKMEFPSSWDDSDRRGYWLVREVLSPDLAASMSSIIPGQAMTPYVLAAINQVAQIEASPQKRIQPEYARDFLEHRASVEVSYSVHAIDSRARVLVLRDPGGPFFVHYALIPEKLTLDTFDEKYFTDLRTTVRVSDIFGKTVFQDERSLPLELRKEELAMVKDSPFQFSDAFPLVPGRWSLSVLWENAVSKEFATFEAELSIPEPDRVSMSSMVLSRSALVTPAVAGRRAFQVGRVQLSPAVRNAFGPGDPMVLFAQLTGLDDELRRTGVIAFTLTRGTEVLAVIRKSLADVDRNGDLLESFDISKLPPGEYAVTSAIFVGTGELTSEQRERFTIQATPVQDPWSVSPVNPGPGDAANDYLLATQLLNLGRTEQAREAMKTAYDKAPGVERHAVGYARSLLASGDPGRALQILQPFAAGEKGGFDLYAALGDAARASGSPGEAIPYYVKALSMKGRVVEVLNALGDCYEAAGDAALAAKAWRDSLAVNPNQDGIRKKLAEVAGR